MKNNICELCSHSLENNNHGPDQNDFYIDENDNLAYVLIVKFVEKNI